MLHKSKKKIKKFLYDPLFQGDRLVAKRWHIRGRKLQKRAIKLLLKIYGAIVN